MCTPSSCAQVLHLSVMITCHDKGKLSELFLEHRPEQDLGETPHIKGRKRLRSEGVAGREELLELAAGDPAAHIVLQP